MFSFLGDASSAYTKHFSQELEEACARINVEGPLSILGPAVIIFHETQHTEVLSKSECYNLFPFNLLAKQFQNWGSRLIILSRIDKMWYLQDFLTQRFQFKKKPKRVSKCE